MDNYFSKNLRYLRLKRGYSQEFIANFLEKKSFTTIQKWESGAADPPFGMVQKLSDLFDVNIDDFVKVDLENASSETIELISCPYIPNPIACGVPETIDGINQLGTISVPAQFLGKYSRSNKVVIMRTHGESMNKIIPSGSYIAVLTGYEIQNLKDGDLVVFREDYDYSLKHYYDLGDKILFRPNSTDLTFRELVINKDENLKIVGKVIMYSVTI